MNPDDLPRETFEAECRRLGDLFTGALVARDGLALFRAADEVNTADEQFGGVCVYSCGVWQVLALQILEEVATVARLFPEQEFVLGADLTGAPDTVRAGYALATRALSPEPFETVAADAHEQDALSNLTMALATTLVGVRRQAAEIRGRVLS